MNYDTVQFYNSALAIFVGVGVAALSFRLLPPLSPAYRTWRLLRLSLRDLQRLATHPDKWSVEDWDGRIYSRLFVFPNDATPLQRAQLLAVLAVGADIIRVRLAALDLGLGSALDPVFEALAAGNSVTATDGLARLDRRLAALSQSDSEISAALRTRGRILAITDTLVQHRAYFDAGVAK